MGRVAAIDCGTNSIRLLVADLPAGAGRQDRTDPGGAAGGAGLPGAAGAGPDALAGGADLVDVDRRMEIVRLGQGVDRTGRLAPEAIERTRVALTGFAARIAELGASRVRMVATSATRDAANADEFQAMVRGVLGTDPQVLTGVEEARLSFTGAVRGLPAGKYLVVDIGGGSTEFIAGSTGGTPARPGPAGSQAARPVGSAGPYLDRPVGSAGPHVDRLVSVDIGCVRMTERHLRADPPTPEQIAAARDDIATAVQKALGVVGELADARLVGLAGSVTTVTAIALGLPAYQSWRIHHARIPAGEVARVARDLLGMTHAQRLELPVMHPGRADVIGAGSLITSMIVDRTGAVEITASEHDILDGIAWSLA